MKIKKKHKIIVFLSSVLILIVSLCSYWTLKKEKIKIIVNGKEIITSSFKKNIKELLDEKGIKYDNNDKITPNLNDELKDYMQINIVKVDITDQKEYEKVPFEITISEDSNLSKGETKVDQEGKDGEKKMIYELIYEDGKLVEKNLVSEKVVKSPTDKVIKKGIKEEVMVASRGSNSRQMSVVATAYATGSITSTGTKPKWGTIAVDPKVIPYGTKIYIPKFDMTFTAEDCGGAIKGNKIDIFMGSETEAYRWGRRTIDIHILN
nr:G5 domain-containing protein [uncultured Romboutsia sp.]